MGWWTKGDRAWNLKDGRHHTRLGRDVPAILLSLVNDETVESILFLLAAQKLLSASIVKSAGKHLNSVFRIEVKEIASRDL